MMTIYQCAFCQHFQGSRIVEDVSMPKGWRVVDQCPAFPDGIPLEVLDGRVDHRKPYSGDNGISFTAKDADAARLHALCFPEIIKNVGSSPSDR